jgi:hypothetical protein
MSNKHSPLHNSTNHGTVPYKKMDPLYSERNKSSVCYGAQININNCSPGIKKDFRSIDYHLIVLFESSKGLKYLDNIAHDYITGK